MELANRAFHNYFSPCKHGERSVNADVRFEKMRIMHIKTLFRKTRWILVAQLIGTVISALCSGCASTGYMGDRVRDAGDVFSAAVGVGAGAKVRVGPVQTGLLFDFPKAGLRGGQFTRTYGKNDEFFASNHDIQMVCFGVEGCWNDSDVRNKNFQAGTGPGWPPAPSPDSDGFSSIPFFHLHHKQTRSNYSYYTQMEIVAAMGGSLRLGFNPGELLDFLLGWTTLDIYSDDLTGGKANKPLQDSAVPPHPER